MLDSVFFHPVELTCDNKVMSEVAGLTRANPFAATPRGDWYQSKEEAPQAGVRRLRGSVKIGPPRPAAGFADGIAALSMAVVSYKVPWKSFFTLKATAMSL